MEKKKIFISYDRGADVMYLNFDKPLKAEGEEVQTGIFARYNPGTHNLVGLTITNFSRKFGAKPTGVSIPASN